MPATYRKDEGVYRTKHGKPMRKPGRRCQRVLIEPELTTALEAGANYSKAAQRCGIARQSLQRWMREDLYFRDRMMLAKEVGRRRPYWSTEPHSGYYR
jgi:transcriptional regulator with PAS, ATPase and Fis domain